MSRTVRGARILITGAAGDTGSLYAQRAVLDGAKAVVLWDRDDIALTDLATELRSLAGASTAVYAYPVDLTELGAIAQVAHRVRVQAGAPDILINNAGIARGAFFGQHDSGDDTRRIMQVNALAPMYVTREVLPAMIADAYRAKRIVNVASPTGALARAGMSVTAASAAAVASWSDSLRLELAREDHTNVKVTTVVQSYVTAGALAEARGLFAGLTSRAVTLQEQVVDRVWDAMLAGRSRVTLR